MTRKNWDEIKYRISELQFSENNFDLIVAIANGGVIPAAMLQQKLGLPLVLLKINYRDSKQIPVFDKPQLLEHPNFEIKNKHILLVEDRVKTGATLNYAKQLLAEASLVKTFCINGTADYSLYNEACFNFPWII
ncbi:MAG: phosphoribosyltransferase [Sediminibacterium sp.]|jgi:xanthine phosphoribosyltransferase